MQKRTVEQCLLVKKYLAKSMEQAYEMDCKLNKVKKMRSYLFSLEDNYNKLMRLLGYEEEK